MTNNESLPATTGDHCWCETVTDGRRGISYAGTLLIGSGETHTHIKQWLIKKHTELISGQSSLGWVSTKAKH